MMKTERKNTYNSPSAELFLLSASDAVTLNVGLTPQENGDGLEFQWDSPTEEGAGELE